MWDKSADSNQQNKEKYKLLAVDDDPLLRDFYVAVLSDKYEVYTAASGDEAIDFCMMSAPELILLDIEMPGMNGYEACLRLRESLSIPIVFATALTTLEEHLKAYDAGGDDLMTKPLVAEIVQRKVALAISKKQAQEKLLQEKAKLHDMAMSFIASLGEGGVLLNFVRASLVCRSFNELADKLLEAMHDFSLRGSFIIRHDGISLIRTTHGEATSLEQSILEKCSTMGRIFQFKKNMVINYDKISIVITGMPEEEDKVGRIRDNLAILAETAEAFCENVDMRQASVLNAENVQAAVFEASKTVEMVRSNQIQMLMDVRLLLNDMTSKIEDSYSWLGTSQDQEHAINASMNDSVQAILHALATGNQMNDQLENIVKVLKSGNKGSDIDLF